MIGFNSKKLIPIELIIKSADNQLYNSGVFMKARPGVKRCLINNPIIIAIINICFVLLNIIQLIFIYENYTTINIVLGDWSAMIGMKYHFKVAAIMISTMTTILEVIHYY